MGFWDNVTSTVSNVTSTVTDTAQNAVSAVSSTTSNAIQTVEKTVTNTAGDIMNTGNDMVKGLDKAKDNITTTVTEEVTKETEIYTDTTYNVFDSITQTIAEDTQGIFKGGQDISKEILRVEQSAEEALEGVVDEAGQVVSGVAGQIVSIPKGLGQLANVASSPNTILLVGGIAIVAILLM
jgi:phage-related protein